MNSLRKNLLKGHEQLVQAFVYAAESEWISRVHGAHTVMDETTYRDR